MEAPTFLHMVLPNVPPYVSYSWLAMGTLIGVSLAVKSKLSLVPSGIQNVMEVFAEFFLSTANSNIGHHYGEKFYPLLGTIFLYILVSNLFGLIPGFESPTSNINMTASMALPVFLIYQFYGFKVHGGSYIKHFLGPIRSVAAIPFMIFMFFLDIAMILALFFALSGFLVTASLLRCKSLISFLGLRVLRIGPALAVEPTLAAVIIRSVFTELPLAQYVADPTFHAYFLNIVGDIHYELPGVFLHNPLPDVVNAQLWTVPYELWCYVILALLAVTTICFNRVAYLVFLAIVQVALVRYEVYRWEEVPIQLRAHLLVFCFLAGVGFYLWRDKVPFNRTACLVALLLCAAGMGPARRRDPRTAAAARTGS